VNVEHFKIFHAFLSWQQDFFYEKAIPWNAWVFLLDGVIAQ